MAWTTSFPISAGFDWTDAAFLDQFFSALRERRAVISPSAPNFPTLGELPGMEIAGSVFTIDSGVWEAYPLSGLQGSVMNRRSDFVDHVQYPSLDGVTPPPDDVLFPCWSHERFFEEINGQAGFTRRFPLCISNPAGDAGSLGQRAYLGGEDSAVTRRAPSTFKTIYEHDGSAWVIAADQAAGPDILIDYGTAQRGDYIGAWIWNELYAAINLLRWTWRALSDATPVDAENYSGQSGNLTSQPRTYSQAFSEAQSDFQSPGIYPGGVCGSFSLNHRFETGGEVFHQVTLIAGSAAIQYTITGSPVSLAHAFEAYLFIEAPGTWLNYQPGTYTHVWDTSAAAISIPASDTWGLIESMPTAVAETRKTKQLLTDPSAIPVHGAPSAPTPPEQNQTLRQGMKLGGANQGPPYRFGGYAKWDVPGGFEYVD